MTRRLLVACVLAMVACAEPANVPLEPSVGAIPDEPAVPGDAAEPFRTIDEIWADLARGPIPGYAGRLYANGTHVILMTAAGDIETARAYVDERGERPFADVDTVVRVEFDFSELYDWKMLLGDAGVWDALTWADIDERDNRIELGAYREEVENVLETALDLGIPRAAIEVTRGDMIVRGTISEIRGATSFLLIGATSDIGDIESPLLVHHRDDADVPPVHACVEIQSSTLVLTSLPPQIGARRLERIEC